MDSDAEGLSPDEAFWLLGDQMRVAILRAVWVSSEEPNTFSEIRERIGSPDSGKFNYHLNKLVGHFLSKAEGFPDGNPDDWPVGNEHTYHGPRLSEYLRELYDRTFSNYDVMTVAEMADTTVDMAGEYLGEDGDGLDMILHFEHMDVDVSPRGRFDPTEWGEWDLVEFKEIMTRWQTELGDDWTAQYLGNHDQPRIVSRFGEDDAYRVESAKLLATFLLTTRGTPFVYQGEEIGMTNDEFDSLAELDDPMTIGAVEDAVDDGRADSFADLRSFVNYVSRDHARTPMQWSDDEHAGFTTGTPWFDVNGNYPDINVAAARDDQDSIWHHYRRLIDLRRREPTLVYGEYALLLPEHEQIYAYTRTLDDEQLLIVLNWSGESAAFDPAADLELADATPLCSNYGTRSTPVERSFEPYEAVVYRL